MTLLTINIEKIGLKDAGQCIDPYITVSVKGNDFCSWLLVSSLQKLFSESSIFYLFNLQGEVFVWSCISCCDLKASAFSRVEKSCIWEILGGESLQEKHSAVPSPSWRTSISDLADCTSLFHFR